MQCMFIRHGKRSLQLQVRFYLTDIKTTGSFLAVFIAGQKQVTTAPTDYIPFYDCLFLLLVISSHV